MYEYYITSIRMTKEQKKKLKMYGVKHDCTAGEAIGKLLKIAEKVEKQEEEKYNGR